MPSEDITAKISEIVTYSYHTLDVNCAKTTLIALSQLLEHPLHDEVLRASTALNGGGRTQAQCGLVEGALMFFGVFYSGKGATDCDIYSIAADFMRGFAERFGSVSCYDLRPGGFQKDDPPHKCEGLTLETVAFTYDFIQSRQQARFNLHSL